MLAPVHIENDLYLIHSFRAEDIRRENAIIKDIYAIFSNDAIFGFLPGKRLVSLKEGEIYFRGNLLSYHVGKNYLHFIKDKRTHRIIGVIDLVSTELAKEHYQLGSYPYFIEFFLKSEFQGRGIVGNLLPEFVKLLSKKNIKEVGAVVNRNNIIARKLIQKINFSYRSEFDFLQDYYTITLN